MLLQKRQTLVFTLPTGIKPEIDGSTPANGWVTANTKTIHHYFAADERRRATFRKHLEKNYYGLILYEGDNWTAYGWMSRPSTPGPAHLPTAIQRLDAYWIFYCRTNEAYRGRGLYQTVLKLLIQQALKESRTAEIYIDTDVDNIAARRAKLSVGFQPKGIIMTKRFYLPKLASWIQGKWDTEAPHPELPERKESETSPNVKPTTLT